ncbi:DUF2059 domain-containing protein [Luteibacter anthropi]|uniref:DUF2059 domain-containing protein n=1 Tax=Luteibacter anthropi TaxID=564369 RepID=A0A7X5UC61_9GAMM|nr:DUF2059 domain-containing protein [Luteibacter anthropi]NII07750.1 DUF2059 domain-containing protein [Luteibacter anthropi]URX61044.1 DUF2059 domain-containing protein [Luteibacter anthropi]
MRKWTGIATGLVLAVCTAGQAMAAQPSEQQVRKLMDVVGMGRMLSQMNSQMAGVMQNALPCVPASYWQGFVDANATNQLIGRMVPVYQKHFTDKEIDELLKFYSTPTGQKVIREMPATMAEGMQIGKAWGQERGQQMIAQLQSQGTLNAQGQCPATGAATNPAPAPKK